MPNLTPESQDDPDVEFTGGLVSISPWTFIGAFLLVASPFIVFAATVCLVRILTGH